MRVVPWHEVTPRYGHHRRIRLLGTAASVIGAVSSFSRYHFLPEYFACGLLIVGCATIVLAYKLPMQERRSIMKAISRFGLGAADLVLDVGCSHGVMLAPIGHELATGICVAVLRPSADSLAIGFEARRNACLNAVAHRTLVVTASPWCLPIPSHQAEFAILHLRELEVTQAALPTVLAEALRVLRPGGRLILHAPESPRASATLVQHSGFENVELEGPMCLDLCACTILGTSATEPAEVPLHPPRPDSTRSSA